MKKLLLLILGLCAMSALFFLLVRNPPTKSSQLENIVPSSVRLSATNFVASKSPSSVPPNVTPLNLAEGVPTNATVLTPRISTAAPVQVVTHSGKDFSWGTFDGTVAQESLQLSPGSASKVVGNGTLVSGTFVSIQHLGHQSFDTISLDPKATIPAGAVLKLGLRVLNGGNWSGWQDLGPVELDQPISINGWATGWQYRFTFSAPSAAASPQVHRITVTTRNSDAVVAAVKAKEEIKESSGVLSEDAPPETDSRSR